MPYTKQEQRSKTWVSIGATDKVGDLTYQLATVVGRYTLVHGLSYDTFSDVTSALVDCLTEYKRQLSDRYEDMKRRENGDVAEWIVIKNMLREMGADVP
jgi:hypothetical protein